MNWLAIVQKDLKTISREKFAWISMIILPLLVITIAGFALSGLINTEIPELKLGYVYSGDENNLIPILHGLEESKSLTLVQVNTLQSGLEMVQDSTISALLSIPDDFNIGVQNKKYSITYYYDISNQSTANIIEGIVRGIISSLNNSLSTIELLVKQAETQGLPVESSLSQIITDVENAFHQDSRINLTPHEIGGEEKNKSFYQVIPGFSVMFLLFSIIGGSTKLFEERQSKTLRRILIAPVRKSEILIGKWISITIEGFIQSIILFTAAKFIFKISLGKNPLYLFSFLLVAACATGAIGIFIASVSKTLKQANGISMILFMVMSALGGSWWPLDITPKFMQTIGNLTFNYWAISVIKKLILFNQTFTGIGIEIIILLAICLLFISLSFKHFKFE